MKIGIDLVPVKRIEKMDRGAIERLLGDEEIKERSVESLAGKIAIKEALIKVGVIKIGQWREVLVLNRDDGSAFVKYSNGDEIEGINLSISHTDELAVGVVVYEK